MTQSLLSMDQAVLLANQAQAVFSHEIDLSSPNVPNDRMESLKSLYTKLAFKYNGRKQHKPDPIQTLLSINDYDDKIQLENAKQYASAVHYFGNQIKDINENILCLLPNIRPIKGSNFYALYDDDNKPIAVIATIRTVSQQTKKLLAKAESYIEAEYSIFYQKPLYLLERLAPDTREEIEFKNQHLIKTDYLSFFEQHANDRYLYHKAIILLAQVMIDNELIPDKFNIAPMLSMSGF